MAVGDSSPATSPGFSQDSLNFEPLGSAESLALGALEPPAHLSRLLARQLPPECEMPHYEATGQEATEAESDPQDGLEQAEVVEGLGPEACPGLPGQGLRYLEHLCLVLEQVANLQRLCLQLQTQRGPGDSEEEEETALAPSPPPSAAPDSEVHGPWGWLSQTEETGAKTASPPKVGAPSASPPRLSEALAEPAHTFSSYQEHKGDRSHWNKVKVLLNRIRWGSPRPAEPATSADGPVPSESCDSAPRIALRGLPERPLGHPLQKTFMPSSVVKKKQDKNPSAH
nr:uncharacterized protein C8orf58 homolog [Odocoileus virginianus texanus]